MIKVSNVTTGYGDQVVTEGLDFELKPGDFIALIGSNGAGKSTLINTIIGVLPTLSGTVTWDVKDQKDNPFNRLGFSPQAQIIDWYTLAYDNVYQGPILAGFSKKDAVKQTNEAMEIMDIVSLKDKPVDHLSGGQQQRVQVAREIARKPDVYILDEPTTGLDVETSEALFKFLLDKTKEGAAVLTSSHDLTLLENYAEKVLFINDHRQAYYGAMDDFKSGSSLRDTYLNKRKGDD
ncbi:MAG: metal ABC transporter ATP-binding protein [Lactobacillus sp.]|nr:metal ABC transporter ATP-binding protein [Lactobacillus sp.]